MLRGLYTATSAMETSQKKLDTISNNMANINTTAFKKDAVISQSFPETLIRKINGQLPSEPYKNNPNVEVKRDGDAYILSTEGGYFTAQGPLGVSYDSSTTFAIDDEGYLKTFGRDIDGKINTVRGNYILDDKGQRVQVDEGEIQINELGQLQANGTTVNLVNKVNKGPHSNIIGTINSGLRLDKIQTYFTQGRLEETGSPLDIAIEGQGFFVVDTPQGEMYTRNGNFSLNDSGEIVTKEGHRLLGESGPIVLEGDFEIKDFQINEEGELLLNNEIIDKIEILHIRNANDLRKYGEGYYQIEEGIEGDFDTFEGKVIQGYLEGSNVDSIKEMVEMISNLRLYESNQKIVQAYDEVLQRAVNDIGKV